MRGPEPVAQGPGLAGAWRVRSSFGRSLHLHPEPWKRAPRGVLSRPLAPAPLATGRPALHRGLTPHLPHRMTAGSRAVPPTAHTSSRTPAPRRAHRGRGPGHPGPTSFPQFKLPAAGEAGSLRAGAWRRGGGRKLGVTLPETPDGPRRGSRVGGRAGIKGSPSSVALGHVTVAGAPRRVRAKAATSGDPQQRVRGGRGRLCLLCRRGSPPNNPSPRAPSALHSPGFPSGLARLGSCQGTELTFASREFQLAADQISGRARLSGHRGGAAPPPPRRAKRAPDGNKDEDAAPPASPGRGGERRPRREKLPTRGTVARPPQRIWGAWVGPGQGSGQDDLCGSSCLSH